MAKSNITLVKGVIQKVATNVTVGSIRNLSQDCNIFFLELDTGADAPTQDEMAAGMCLAFAEDGVTEPIDSSVAIDVYMVSPEKDCRIRAVLP